MLARVYALMCPASLKHLIFYEGDGGSPGGVKLEILMQGEVLLRGCDL